MEEHDINARLLEMYRLAIEAGWSLNAIARAIEVSPGRIQAFQAEETALSCANATKLADFFNMRLTKGRIPKP